MANTRATPDDVFYGGAPLAPKFPTANPAPGYTGGYIHSPGSAPQPAAVYTQAASIYQGEHTVVPTGGGTSGGGEGPPPPPSPPPAPPLDWRAYLTNWGFDQKIVDELDRIFRTYSDPNQASAPAVAYIRGTDWYSKTFPGIQEGMKLGIIGNEQDYRSYTNQLNDLYNRYYGRNVTGAEVAQKLGAGFSASRTGAQLSGEAFVKANRNDIQFTLGAYGNGQASDQELQALGEENAGLDSLLGQQLQARLDKARQRLATAFQGTLATPSLRVLSNGRLSTGTGINTNDVAA